MDYLLHADFKLGHHDYVAAAARKSVQLKLYLIRLSDADLMDLGPVLATSLEEAREAERQKVAVDGDGWGEREPEVNANAQLLPMDFIPFDEIRWPFRVSDGSVRCESAHAVHFSPKTRQHPTTYAPLAAT